MKPRIKIAFADFWSSFNTNDNYFTRLLSRRFEVDIASDPDYLIYSCFGKQHLKFSGIRIFYTGENVRPDFKTCDYAFTFDNLNHPEHYRLPLYGLNRPERAIKGPLDCDRILREKTRFCNFIYANPRCRKRNNFFYKLSKYKQVDSGGRLWNNIGGPVRHKHGFQKYYKFSIAFENASYPGYTTEKIFHPMVVNSLPVYWGNPQVSLDFNPQSFLNYFDYGSDEALIDRIIELDRDDEKYLQYHRQSWYHGNRVNAYVAPENVLAQFETIFNTPKRPVAQSQKFHFAHRQKQRLLRNSNRLWRQAVRAIRAE